ncbi:DMT family transporter [Luteimonas fraxinea]|uniref:DMT family transporter n=1 Tax=Luteimonas fraxinea TaxID=2901869 RepID=A0ABS8UBQ5_9GAMM|nr:DMT family transporter [Luteimonas fraxinea]MCD9096305.1 DMT family transporter [Luteimonas fraxinea]MCD9125648.1 DMT family transporter [Luteimonas fraxinea]UHH10317.1 DMT family transporter [Luteimonas fraxinea]
MHHWLLLSIVVAVLVGMLLPLQALLNARVGALTEGALFASFLSFAVGTFALGLVLLVTRTQLPSMRTLATLPPWLWCGGLIGAVFVFCGTLLVPRLGAAGMICLIVAGQLVGSLLLDHYGVLSQPRPVDAVRLAGAVLVGIGALLVVRPWQAG